MQQYPEGGYCPYCGNPVQLTTGSITEIPQVTTTQGLIKEIEQKTDERSLDWQKIKNTRKYLEDLLKAFCEKYKSEYRLDVSVKSEGHLPDPNLRVVQIFKVISKWNAQTVRDRILLQFVTEQFLTFEQILERLAIQYVGISVNSINKVFQDMVKRHQLKRIHNKENKENALYTLPEYDHQEGEDIN